MKYRQQMRHTSFALATIALLIATASTSAQATIVTIDTSKSFVTYIPSNIVICDPSGNCGAPPTPKTFALSGSFDVKQETIPFVYSFYPYETIDIPTIRFASIAVDSGGAAALGFNFPYYMGAMSGAKTFAASEDPCSLGPTMGSCTSTGYFGEFSGEFDGRRLTFSGHSYPNTFDQISFTVVANSAAPVPEPEFYAMLLVGLGLMGVVVRRRKQVAKV